MNFFDFNSPFNNLLLYGRTLVTLKTLPGNSMSLLDVYKCELECSLFKLKYWDIKLKAPEHVKDVLEWRYGKDYMTPKRGFKGRDS